MTAAAKLCADIAHIHGIVAASGHNLDAVAHPANGEKDGKFFHFHELVGKIGKITKIIVQAGFGQNNGYIVDDVCPGRFHEAVQSLDMHARELVRGHFIDSVDVHALAQKPCRGQKIVPGGG